jgi:hypothetical protein
VAQDFFQRITASHYVFSGNGRHGNPERETIEMLLAARPRAKFQLHFTYPLEEIDEARRREAGAGWSAERHGLTTLFGAMTSAGKRMFNFVSPGTPHVIDLLQPLDR